MLKVIGIVYVTLYLIYFYDLFFLLADLFFGDNLKIKNTILKKISIVYLKLIIIVVITNLLMNNGILNIKSLISSLIAIIELQIFLLGLAVVTFKIFTLGKLKVLTKYTSKHDILFNIFLLGLGIAFYSFFTFKDK